MSLLSATGIPNLGTPTGSHYHDQSKNKEEQAKVALGSSAASTASASTMTAAAQNPVSQPSGEDQTLEWLLFSNANVKGVVRLIQDYSQDVLFLAAEKANHEALKFLIGTDFSLQNCKDEEGNTLLRLAARGPQLHGGLIDDMMIIRACECGSGNYKDKEKHENGCRAALHLNSNDATRKPYKETCRVVWNALAPILKEGNRPNIIRVAYEQGHMPEVRWFVDKQEDEEDEDKFIDSTKYEECIDKLLKICEEHVRELEGLEKFLKPNLKPYDIVGESGRNALHHAAADGNIAKFKKLVEFEEGLNDADKKRWIDCSYKFSNMWDRDQLLERSDSNGYTPLGLAAFFGHTAICKYLWEKSDTISSVRDWFRHDTCKVKIIKEGTFGDQDKDGFKYDLYANYTVLHIAITRGHTDLVKLLAADKNLREKKAQFKYECEDKFGSKQQRLENPPDQTPLMLAASLGYVAACKALLDAGADPQAADANGFNALLYAARNGQTAVINLFKDSLPDLLKSKTVEDQTPLHLAILSKQVAACQLLIDNGADPAAVDKNGKNCFSYAEESNNEQIKKLLASRKPTPNFLGKGHPFGGTPQ
jgi:ankyrin repeat protein